MVTLSRDDSRISARAYFYLLPEAKSPQYLNSQRGHYYYSNTFDINNDTLQPFMISDNSKFDDMGR